MIEIQHESCSHLQTGCSTRIGEFPQFGCKPHISLSLTKRNKSLAGLHLGVYERVRVERHTTWYPSLASLGNSQTCFVKQATSKAGLNHSSVQAHIYNKMTVAWCSDLYKQAWVILHPQCHMAQASISSMPLYAHTDPQFRDTDHSQLICTQQYAGVNNTRSYNMPFTFSVTAPLKGDMFGGDTYFHDIAASFNLPYSFYSTAGEGSSTYNYTAEAVLSVGDANPNNFTISAAGVRRFDDEVLNIPADRSQVLGASGPVRFFAADGMKITNLVFSSVRVTAYPVGSSPLTIVRNLTHS